MSHSPACATSCAAQMCPQIPACLHVSWLGKGCKALQLGLLCLAVAGCGSTAENPLHERCQPRGVCVQIGSFVPAESVRMHVFDSVFTRMGASDNLAMGRSTFLEVSVTFSPSTCGRTPITMTASHNC